MPLLCDGAQLLRLSRQEIKLSWKCQIQIPCIFHFQHISFEGS